jgi:hypothetical protein
MDVGISFQAEKGKPFPVFRWQLADSLSDSAIDAFGHKVPDGVIVLICRKIKNDGL